MGWEKMDRIIVHRTLEKLKTKEAKGVEARWVVRRPEGRDEARRVVGSVRFGVSSSGVRRESEGREVSVREEVGKGEEGRRRGED